MKKSLFNEKERYTETAQNIEQEMRNALSPILMKYRNEFLLRELQILMNNAALDITLMELI